MIFIFVIYYSLKNKSKVNNNDKFEKDTNRLIYNPCSDACFLCSGRFGIQDEIEINHCKHCVIRHCDKKKHINELCLLCKEYPCVKLKGMLKSVTKIYKAVRKE
jgi:hypothetical protein